MIRDGLLFFLRLTIPFVRECVNVYTYVHCAYVFLVATAGWCPRPCDGVKKDISAAALNKLKAFLAAAPTQYRWLNLQGP